MDEDAIFTTITLKEEVSEINKQNQLISVHRKDRVHRYYRVFLCSEITVNILSG